MKTAWKSLKNFFLRFDDDGDNEDDNVDDDNTAGDGDFLKNFFLRSDYDNDDDE